MREVLTRFGMSDSSSNYTGTKRYLQRVGITTTHFLTRSEIARRTMLRMINKVPDSIVFIRNSVYARASVKSRLLNYLPYICSICGQDENWIGKKMTLIMDHINGVNNDNRLENLRFVCPNCNSTLGTHCRGSRGLIEKVRLDRRFKKVRSDLGLPSNGSRTGPGKFSDRRPNKDELVMSIERVGYVKTGKKYEVSDNAVRKWIKFYGLNPSLVQKNRMFPYEGKDISLSLVGGSQTSR